MEAALFFGVTAIAGFLVGWFVLAPRNGITNQPQLLLYSLFMAVVAPIALAGFLVVVGFKIVELVTNQMS